MNQAPDRASADSFTDFVREAEPRVRRALTAAFGPEIGGEVTAEAFGVAWESWDFVSGRPNRVGYVWGIGRNLARQRLRVRERPLFPQPEPQREPWIEPQLPAAFERLTENQRLAVVLTQGFGWTLREVGELLDISIPSVQKHCDRGLAKLRDEMGVDDD